MWKNVKVGEKMTRIFCGTRETWAVTSVTELTLTIGLGWTFCNSCGAEIDEDLGWDCGQSGSQLLEPGQ